MGCRGRRTACDTHQRLIVRATRGWLSLFATVNVAKCQVPHCLGCTMPLVMAMVVRQDLCSVVAHARHCLSLCMDDEVCGPAPKLTSFASSPTVLLPDGSNLQQAR